MCLWQSSISSARGSEELAGVQGVSDSQSFGLIVTFVLLKDEIVCSKVTQDKGQLGTIEVLGKIVVLCTAVRKVNGYVADLLKPRASQPWRS